MHSHSFLDEELKLHRNVDDFPREVVGRLTFLPFPHRGHKLRVNHSKNVNSTCIRTVFKMKSWNFTGTSVTPRDRSFMGWRFYRSPIRVRNEGLIPQKREFDVHSHSFQDEELKLHRNVDDFPREVVGRLTFLPFPQRGHKLRVNHSKNVNSTCIRTVFKMKSWNFTGTSVTPRDRSFMGWRFYRSPIRVRNEGLIPPKTWIRRAFAQFSRWRVEISQERRWLFGTGRGKVKVSTVPP